MGLLRNRQRIIPDEASHRAMSVACGCVSTDRRVELGKLFALLRGDGIFPSAVTLGQYTRALAEGYSKRATVLGDGISAGGVDVSVGHKAMRSEHQSRCSEDLILNSLDWDIAVLEESCRRWRSRLSHRREWEQTEPPNTDGSWMKDGGETPSVSRTAKRKLRNTTKPWHPVVMSSSFAPRPPRECQSSSSVEFSSGTTLEALWSRTTACDGCSYVPLDEEIQSGWDVAGDDSQWRTSMSCSRCDSLIRSRQGYGEMYLDEGSILCRNRRMHTKERRGW